VVGAEEGLAGQLVHAGRQPFGEPAVVDEDDGAAVRSDELEEARYHGRPDRHAGFDAVAPLDRVGEVGTRFGTRHIRHGHDDLEVERLGRLGLHDFDGAVAAEEPGCLFEGPLGGREADALRVPVGEGGEPLEAEGEVGTALRGRHRVDLVHDDDLYRAQRLALPGGEDEVERFGRGDKDVGRRPPEITVAGRGIPGADGRADLDGREPKDLACKPDPGEGRAEVPLDVVGQRLQGGDVEDADPRGCILSREFRADEAVDGSEERCEGLPRPSRREEERVVTGGNDGPAARLDGRRPGEGPLEPEARGRREEVEGRIHAPIVARAATPAQRRGVG